MNHLKESTIIDQKGTRYAVHNKDFYAYLQKKDLKLEDVIKMTPQQKEQFFLRWKHGMTDLNTNRDFEYTLQMFIKNFEGMALEAVDPYFQESLRSRREFEQYCELIKTQIRLWQRTARPIEQHKELPKEIKDLVGTIGGTVFSFEDVK